MLNQKVKKVIAGVTCMVLTACTVMAGSQKAAGQIDGMAAASNEEENEIIGNSAVWQADLTHDGTQETICFDKKSMQETGDSEITVVSSEGKTLFSKAMSTSHVGWGTFALYNDRDGDYLLEYNPYFGQGIGVYSYRLFSLSDSGEIITRERKRVEFSAGMPHTAPDNDIAKLIRFADAANVYWKKAVLLVTTDQNMLLPNLYDADGNAAAVQASENYYIAPNTLENPLHYVERMSWTDFVLDVDGGQSTGTMSMRSRLKAVNRILAKNRKDAETEAIKLGKPVLRTASRPNGKIKISWDRTEGAAKYVLFRSTKKDGGFHKVFQTKNTYSYTDQGRIAGQPYYYRLSAYTKGQAKRSDSKIAKGRSLEKVPLNGISNLSGSRKLVLQWKRVKGAEGYQIWRKNKAGKYQEVATVKGKKNSFTDKKLHGGKIYSYKVCAVDANGGRGNLGNQSRQLAIDANRKMIALTYDDGPCIYTPAVLDALEKYDAHATFFVVGSSVNRYADSIRREAALGCEIGNHTYNHTNLRTLSAAQVQSAILETNRVVKQQCGLDIHVMRPPGGNYNSAVCAEVGMPVIMWSVATQDWQTRSSAATIQCVKQNAFDGAVVIMHDLHKSTADAADTIVGYLKSAGYQMVTISELAAYRGGMTAGKVYSQFRK